MTDSLDEWQEIKAMVESIEPSPLIKAYSRLMESANGGITERDVLEASKVLYGEPKAVFASHLMKEIAYSQQNLTNRKITPGHGNWDRLINGVFSVFSTGMAEMAQEKQSLEERLAKKEKEAKTDELTNLGNRRAFEEYSPTETAYASIDVDYFKRINDNLGHAVGDITLHTIADLVSGTLRKGEQAFRVGGEEFKVKFHYTMDEEAMMGAGERIRKTVETMGAQTVYFKLLNMGMDDEAEGVKKLFEDFKKPLSVSVGLAYRLNDSKDATNNSIHNSDIALYNAKIDRNSVVLYQPGMEVPEKTKSIS